MRAERKTEVPMVKERECPKVVMDAWAMKNWSRIPYRGIYDRGARNLLFRRVIELMVLDPTIGRCPETIAELTMWPGTMSRLNEAIRNARRMLHVVDYGADRPMYVDVDHYHAVCMSRGVTPYKVGNDNGDGVSSKAMNKSEYDTRIRLHRIAAQRAADSRLAKVSIKTPSGDAIRTGDQVPIPEPVEPTVIDADTVVDNADATGVAIVGYDSQAHAEPNIVWSSEPAPAVESNPANPVDVLVEIMEIRAIMQRVDMVELHVTETGAAWKRKVVRVDVEDGEYPF